MVSTEDKWPYQFLTSEQAKHEKPQTPVSGQRETPKSAQFKVSSNLYVSKRGNSGVQGHFKSPELKPLASS
jgi:hypothetical protein